MSVQCTRLLVQCTLCIMLCNPPPHFACRVVGLCFRSRFDSALVFHFSPFVSVFPLISFSLCLKPPCPSPPPYPNREPLGNFCTKQNSCSSLLCSLLLFIALHGLFSEAAGLHIAGGEHKGIVINKETKAAAADLADFYIFQRGD